MNLIFQNDAIIVFKLDVNTIIGACKALSLRYKLFSSPLSKYQEYMKITNFNIKMYKNVNEIYGKIV